MSKDISELVKVMEYALAMTGELTRSKAVQPSDQNLLDGGWIRHTGDFCPVHEKDEVALIFADGSMTNRFTEEAIEWNWGASELKITHYKVVKAYDPHAKNKTLYAQDAKVHEKPWELWEFKSEISGWTQHTDAPGWFGGRKYRRKQTKLVDWSCPLLKGANTNYGEWLAVYLDDKHGLIFTVRNAICRNLEDIRLAHTDATPSNWQAYNGEDLNLLHEAGFVLEVKYVDYYTLSTVVIAAYRVIAIRDGFTDNPTEVL